MQPQCCLIVNCPPQLQGAAHHSCINIAKLVRIGLGHSATVLPFPWFLLSLIWLPPAIVPTSPCFFQTTSFLFLISYSHLALVSPPLHCSLHFLPPSAHCPSHCELSSESFISLFPFLVSPLPFPSIIFIHNTTYASRRFQFVHCLLCTLSSVTLLLGSLSLNLLTTLTFPPFPSLQSNSCS